MTFKDLLVNPFVAGRMQILRPFRVASRRTGGIAVAFASAVLFSLVTFSSGAYALIGGNPNGTADWALINGKIYTMDEDQPWAEAIAVQGNKITYVGATKGLKDFIGMGTEVVDLDGKMVMPSFLDGHMHPFAGALVARGVDLQTDDMDELKQKIADYAKANPDLEVLTGFGWRLSLFPDRLPTAEMLDKIVSDRPVFFWAIDAHNAWVNSKALEMAGIDKDTPDPVPGYSYFQRDEQDTPDGGIIEVPAMM